MFTDRFFVKRRFSVKKAELLHKNSRKQKKYHYIRNNIFFIGGFRLYGTIHEKW